MIRCGKVTRHGAVERDYIVALLLCVAVLCGAGRGIRFQVIINVGAFYHLYEIDFYSIKQLSRLRVGVHLFVAERRNSSRTVEQLRRKKNEQNQNSSRN